jgi:hypothetical protein
MSPRRDLQGTMAASGPIEELAYRIELWRDGDASSVERVLARAATAGLGRAIFKAAMAEHPGRRITLCQGHRTIADSFR